MKYLIPLLLFSLFIYSCTDDEIEDPNTDIGYEYFPLEVGKYKAYRIDSILFDGNDRRSSTTYRLEEIVAISMDLENDTIYELKISQRNDITQSWVQTHFAIEKINLTRAERSEENLRFIKLSFPIKIDRPWNGNAFIADRLVTKIEGENVEIFTGWNGYHIDEEPLPLTIGDLQFDKTIEVIESTDDQGIISLRESKSIYAENVGLVKRTQRILDITGCNGTADNPCHNPNNEWADEAEAGYIVEQEIIDYN